jgi:hypothetical protein
MNGVSPVLARPALAPSTTAHGAGPAPALLAAAAEPTVPEVQNALAQLYEVIAQLREQQAKHGKSEVDVATAARDIEATRQKEALDRARAAAEEGGVFDWIAKDIGLAGAVGLVTFNYPLVAADIAAHELGLFEHVEEKIDLVDVAAVATGRWEVVAADVLVRKTDLAPADLRKLLEKCGVPSDAPSISKEDIEPIAKDVLLANLLVLSTAATVLSCGTTGALVVALLGVAISMGGAKLAEEKALDPLLGDGTSKWVGLGMQIYGTAAACMSGFAGGAAILPASGARGAAIAHGITAGARGGDQIVTAVNERARDEANIEAEGARHGVARLERLIEQITDAIEEVYDSHRKAAETLQGIIDVVNEKDLALTRAIKG